MKFRICDSDEVFEGIDLCGEWNGYARPAFDKGVADSIMEYYNSLDGNEDFPMSYNESEDGGYYTVNDGEEIVELYDAMTVDGSAYYPIGAGLWAWEVA